MNITRRVAEFAVNTNYEDFDAETKKWAKRVLLSSFGMTLAGAQTNTGDRILSYIKKAPAPQESGVIGAGFKTSANYAAIAMGTTSHSTELEDDAPPELSTDVGYFPAVIAVGEKLHVSGKEIIESMVIAYEIGSRLTQATVGMAASLGGIGPYFCTVATAASTARMLKLDVEKTTMAASLAVSQANWFLWFQTGTDAHFYEQGTSMSNGIEAAYLAQHGLTGSPEALDIYCRSLIGAGPGEPINLRLGNPYRITEIGIKKYPCCYLQMNYIDAFVDLVRDHNLSAEDVTSVQVDVAPVTTQVLRYHHPKDEMESRFSLAHSIACTFLDKKPFLDSYTTERANDPEVKSLRDKIQIITHPEWNSADSPIGAAMPIVVKMKDGSEYRKISLKASDPIIISDEEMMDKYMKCATRVVSQSKAEQFAETIMALEMVDDISEFIAQLTFLEK